MSRIFPKILASPIEYLKGVGPHRADMLRKELQISSFRDLLEFYPYRHVDKSRINTINEISAGTEFIQIAGILGALNILGEGRTRRLVSEIKDATGSLQLVWFQSISWMQRTLNPGFRYLVYGKLSFFNGEPQLTHPEMESFTQEKGPEAFPLQPVYPSTEKLKARGLGGRQLSKFTHQLFSQLRENDIPEFLPGQILESLSLTPRFQAFKDIHFPASPAAYLDSLNRLKFDEMFLNQIRTGMIKSQRQKNSRGVVFEQVGPLFNEFYSKVLPFELTGAQKRVLKEIRRDTATGKQMNRLLQGDVGSGKTMVALLTMLLAADNGFQSCLLAPTEILSRQHADHFRELLKDLPISVALLTGTVKSAARKKILHELASGSLNILIGTHAIIEDAVQFRNLGLAIIDEQHRFGVAQRAKLWKKAGIPPHVLVMTATPIPRTLAMTAYNDLDYSIIDELPPGRQPVRTVQRYEYNRPKVMDFIKDEIKKGRQAYIIFPLIEESEKLDYENLLKGYENVKAYFPEPPYYISMVHGRQKPIVRETNMKRFISGETQIMVATTVVEVGVNIPNASVMLIESAEKFGLSQLHQLRGRVGRGNEQSFCILLSGNKLGKDARERLNIMCETTDGFRIAEKDMELRGPGDIAGTRQSGILDFKLADIVRDKNILQQAIRSADRVLAEDPELQLADHALLRGQLMQERGKTVWSRIS
ncbi:MAG: ATP-dependent DNA helicase RecG [Bacteroidota bacterium]|nr:ATP-dependent DNA helicase RecG [Bacteroidota bacterium]MDP4211004.1 ATP-dependent DNA helicase RecG [Bacteroidota bacterium]MDP4248774.1 ATP-dependent DNA helicase RecG [Bacteroidota bacterium]